MVPCTPSAALSPSMNRQQPVSSSFKPSNETVGFDAGVDSGVDAGAGVAAGVGAAGGAEIGSSVGAGVGAGVAGWATEQVLSVADHLHSGAALHFALFASGAHVSGSGVDAGAGVDVAGGVGASAAVVQAPPDHLHPSKDFLHLLFLVSSAQLPARRVL